MIRDEKMRNRVRLGIERFIETWIKYWYAFIFLEIAILGLAVYGVVVLMSSFFTPGL